MAQIERHIEILLLTNDCVIIPDLGGFVANYVPARYDDTDGMFLPPMRTIGFNPQLTMNDSLLAWQYVEAYDISYPDALKRIAGEVAELRQRLETENEYEMPGLGTLSYGEEGQLVFQPCEAGILTPQLYGLDAFQMEHVRQQALPEKEKHKEKRTDAIVIPLSWVRNSVAAVAAAVAFFFILTPVTNSKMESGQRVEQSAFIPTVKPQRALTQKTLTQPLTAREESVVEDTLAEPATPVTVTYPSDDGTEGKSALVTPPSKGVEGGKSFTIVMASYVTKRGAGELVQKLSKKGMDQGRVFTHKNITRAIYGSYSSHDEAVNAMKQLRTQDGTFAEAWVMKVDL